MDLLPILEWSAFGSSLLCSWVYGYRTIAGPVIGIVTAILFMLFGWFSGVPAALAANLVFLIVHTRNGLKMLAEDKSRSLEKIEKGVTYLTSVIDDVLLEESSRVQAAINLLVKETHAASVEAGWWTDLTTGEPLPADIPLKTVLIHSEISEAMEGDRKNLQDNKLPHRKMFEVELADAVIRSGDLAGKLGKNFGLIFIEEMQNPDFVRTDGVLRSDSIQAALCKLHCASSSVFTAGRFGRNNAFEDASRKIARLLIETIRTAKYANLDLGGAIAEKMEFNAPRGS
jgi:uncharacterized membrane protein